MLFAALSPQRRATHFISAVYRRRNDISLNFTTTPALISIVSGRDLMQKGLTVNLPLPLSSELIFLHEE